MRIFALMLLLIGGASAGAAWQGYSWEDLRTDARCVLEETRWGCEDEALVALSRPEPQAPLEQAPSIDRKSCDEIRSTEYRSPTEREWFLANCLTPVSPEEAGGKHRLFEIGDESWCEFYADTDALSDGMFEWWYAVCPDIEIIDTRDLPRHCPFADSEACVGLVQAVGLRATTDIPAGTMFTPAVVERVSIPYKAYGGEHASPAVTLGAMARTDIPADEILLLIMRCPYEVGCP